MTQKELFRSQVLCKIGGRLVIIGVDPSKKVGSLCPLCKRDNFYEDHGWLQCDSCGNFAVLKKHIEDIKEQWEG